MRCLTYPKQGPKLTIFLKNFIVVCISNSLSKWRFSFFFFPFSSNGNRPSKPKKVDLEGHQCHGLFIFPVGQVTYYVLQFSVMLFTTSTLNILFSVIWCFMSLWQLYEEVNKYCHGWWMSSSISQNPTCSCRKLVMKYCHGWLKFGWKSFGYWQLLQQCKSVIIQKIYSNDK